MAGLSGAHRKMCRTGRSPAGRFCFYQHATLLPTRHTIPPIFRPSCKTPPFPAFKYPQKWGVSYAKNDCRGTGYALVAQRNQKRLKSRSSRFVPLRPAVTLPILPLGGCFQWEWLRARKRPYDPVRIRHRPLIRFGFFLEVRQRADDLAGFLI